MTRRVDEEKSIWGQSLWSQNRSLCEEWVKMTVENVSNGLRWRLKTLGAWRESLKMVKGLFGSSWYPLLPPLVLVHAPPPKLINPGKLYVTWYFPPLFGSIECM
jgi:hypothetical protein